MPKKQTPEYQKAYKDQKRVVVYTDPDIKETLGQHAIDTGVSLSSLVNPSLRKLANAINKRNA